MAKPSNNNNNIASSFSAATLMEIAIDGSDSDDFDSDSALSRSQFLTRPEVLKRRSRRLKQLSKIYRDYYWSLIEDLKLKYRDYYWNYGKSPFLEDEDILHSLNHNHSNNYRTTIIPDDIQHPLNNGKLGLGLGLGLGSNGNVLEHQESLFLSGSIRAGDFSAHGFVQNQLLVSSELRATYTISLRISLGLGNLSSLSEFLWKFSLEKEISLKAREGKFL
ncbi:unnamed protein product [Camellia sinensis]